MAMMEFTVSYSQVSKAVDELIRMGRVSNDTAKAFEQGFRKAASWQEKFRTEMGLVNRKLEENYRNQNLSNKSARESASVFEEDTKAKQRNAIALENLKNKYDPLYRSSQLYAKQQGELNTLIASGVGPTGRYQAALDLLNKEYQDFGNGIAQATNRFVTNAVGAQRSMSGLGMVVQQTGYQVGDFLVQVQGGTNWMVAFGQQATQLVGVLPMLSETLGVSVGKLIGISTVLGIAIPLVTAIGAYFMRTGESTKKVEKEVSKLSQTISTLNSVQKMAAADIDKGITKSFKSSASAVGRLLDEISRLDFLAAIKPVKDSISSLSVDIDRVDIALSTMTGFKSLIESGQTLSSVQKSILKDAEALVNENFLLAIQVDDVQESLSKIGGSKTTKELIVNLASARDILEGIGGPVAQEAISALEKMAKEAGVSEAIIQQISESAGTISNGLREATNEAILLRNALASVSMAALSRVDQIAIISAKISAARSSVPGSIGQDVNIARAEAQAETALELSKTAASIDQIAEASARAGDQAASLAALNAELSALTKAPDKPEKEPSGGSQRSKTGISTFVQNLVGTQEGYEAQVAQAEAWKLDALARMQDFNAAELEILREHGGAKFLIEQEYNKQIQDLETAQRNQRLSETASFFGAMASVMQHGGEKMNQVARVLGATEALINTFVAQSQVLKDPKLGFFGKMAAYATIGAAGLGLVSSLRGGGSSGGSTSTGTIATPTAQETQGPQEVIIKGLSAGMRLSPEELQEIFDQLYEENGKRGTIFQVQI